MQEMTISQLARAADVGVETVRYYQRRGLLPTPQLPNGGIRRYDSDTLSRLRFVRRAQALGFSLDEVAELLDLDEHEDRDQARRIASEKLRRIDDQIRQLNAMKQALSELVSCCADGNAAQPCPILHALAHPDEASAHSKSTGGGVSTGRPASAQAS
ncbi:MerR family transcriptional regulator [Nitrogeniibacter mangrovi]|uniref:Mercuric resistance operon regulatory protein n=1 Tax=Nitrogeniibacter mangrovi TaxID=2016596 RepID=A0A6C1B301_9RHOO|nr:MerR family transcriptional regulator [Nitrogeniibacter mangrovi]QID17218.1 MerR family transcriptional regulator [Nitrogeniibacter mangrovi]